MVDSLKVFGKGLLYTVLLPFILIIIVVYMIIGVFYFLFLAIKSCVLFFKGKTIYSKLPEDIKAEEILHGKPKTTNETNEVEVIEGDNQDSLAFNSAFTYSNFDFEVKGEVVEEQQTPEIEEIKSIEEVQTTEEIKETIEDSFVPLEEPEIEEDFTDNLDIQQEEIEEEIPTIINTDSQRLFNDDDDSFEEIESSGVEFTDLEEDY